MVQKRAKWRLNQVLSGNRGAGKASAVESKRKRKKKQTNQCEENHKQSTWILAGTLDWNGLCQNKKKEKKRKERVWMKRSRRRCKLISNYESEICKWRQHNELDVIETSQPNCRNTRQSFEKQDCWQLSRWSKVREVNERKSRNGNEIVQNQVGSSVFFVLFCFFVEGTDQKKENPRWK